MSIIKQTKDYAQKIFLGEDFVPVGLFEISQYFRSNAPIEFDRKNEGGEIVVISKNFRYGSIITTGKTEEELDKNIKDAILTSFDIPSCYARKVKLHKVGSETREYALS